MVIHWRMAGPSSLPSFNACLPHLLKAPNPHILNISLLLNLETRWLAPYLAYTMAKFGLRLCALGMSGDYKKQGVAVIALWPKTVIATATVQNLLGGSDTVKRSRKPEIMADAAHLVLTRSSRDCAGNFFVDEDVLRQAGVTDFDKYAVTPGSDLIPDFFIWLVVDHRAVGIRFQYLEAPSERAFHSL